MTENSNETGGVTEEERRLAMATYSGDGQNDDATGGDALAEVWQDRGADEPEGESAEGHRPTPDDDRSATNL
ncbi:hypothetical protein [Cryptosporangium sp. NPDC051539]|uniref:hypothetical protein n=1 Tax=Cryptosporangium sp. NPDC051539 TaxID=3363962 RepID=UPI00378B78AE